jgi:hypothetical protein
MKLHDIIQKLSDMLPWNLNAVLTEYNDNENSGSLLFSGESPGVWFQIFNLKPLSVLVGFCVSSATCNFLPGPCDPSLLGAGLIPLVWECILDFSVWCDTVTVSNRRSQKVPQDHLVFCPFCFLPCTFAPATQEFNYFLLPCCRIYQLSESYHLAMFLIYIILGLTIRSYVSFFSTFLCKSVNFTKCDNSASSANSLVPKPVKKSYFMSSWSQYNKLCLMKWNMQFCYAFRLT